MLSILPSPVVGAAPRVCDLVGPKRRRGDCPSLTADGYRAVDVSRPTQHALLRMRASNALPEESGHGQLAGSRLPVPNGLARFPVTPFFVHNVRVTYHPEFENLNSRSIWIERLRPTSGLTSCLRWMPSTAPSGSDYLASPTAQSAGIAVGLLTAYACTRLICGLLYGVTPTDPVTFGTASATLLGVAVLACWIPARRTARIDPMIALRLD